MMKYIAYILLFTFLIIAACDNPMEVNRPGDKLTGYVTHVDSNLYLTGGFYSVSLFSADSSSPFSRIPLRTDSLRLTKRDNLYETSYDMDGVPAGRYYIAATWSSYPRVQNEVPLVLGTYGCDTILSCTSHKIVEFPNYQGQFRNIFSWTDPGKRFN
ncbi:MAG: hypothetical protein IAE90_02730 [Ignavibacteria bacterium]|nr:hypothetical protein [Ignavibacteria bacterium]